MPRSSGTLRRTRPTRRVPSATRVADNTLANLQKFQGRYRSAEFNAEGSLFKVPAGEVRSALGVGHRWEEFSNGIFIPGVPSEPDVEADREVSYAFAELRLPILRSSSGGEAGSLEFIASARFEDYSDFGTESVPKLGLVWSTNDSLKIKGTWGEAFRAPNLNDSARRKIVYIVDLPDDGSTSGVSTVLFRDGGNPELEPEVARTWSVGLEASPTQRIAATLNYFDVRYTERISRINNPFAALSDPLNEFFLARSPSLLLQETLISESDSGLLNFTSHEYDPTAVTAVLDFRQVNVARQNVRGVDASVAYLFGEPQRGLDLRLNAAYLDLKQRTVAAAPEETLSGTTFNPPRWRARGEATWTDGSWFLTGIVNYLGRETNTFSDNRPRVGSWTTIDVSLGYTHQTTSGLLSGVRASLSAQNVFDQDPPHVESDGFVQGFNFDSLNANPIGRFIALQLSKNW